MGFQPAITAGAVLDGLSALGFDAAAIAREAGLADTDLRALHAELPLSAFVDMWNAAARHVPSRDTLVVEVGFAVPLGAFGVVDYLACSAETVATGIVALRDHFRAVAFGVALDLVPDAHSAWLDVLSTSAGLPAPLAQAAQEFTIAVTLARLRCATAAAPVVDAVELSRPRPAGATRDDALFQAPVSFDHASTRAHLPRAALTAPMRSSDAALARTLREVAERLAIAGDGGSELEVAVRGRLRDLLPHGKPRPSRSRARSGRRSARSSVGWRTRAARTARSWIASGLPRPSDC